MGTCALTGRDPSSTLAALDARAGRDGGRVWEVARKYTCRWPIEEVHLVLKSGCKVEDFAWRPGTDWRRP